MEAHEIFRDVSGRGRDGMGWDESMFQHGETDKRFILKGVGCVYNYWREIFQ